MRSDAEEKESDVMKANILLAGIISTFIMLTMVAFLLTEGRNYCIIPLLRKFAPTSNWLVQHDNLETCDEKLLILQVGMTQRHNVLGVKRPFRQV